MTEAEYIILLKEKRAEAWIYGDLQRYYDLCLQIALAEFIRENSGHGNGG